MAIEAGDGLVPPVEPAKPQTTPAGGDPNHEPDGGNAPGKGPVKREWIERLPEHLRGHKTLEKFADGEDLMANLAKSYVELEGKLGKSLVIPDENAAPEERAKYFARLGRPETPEKYQVAPGTLDAQFEGILRAKAFEKGVSQEHLSAFVDATVEAVKLARAGAEERAKAEAKAQAAKVEAGIAALKTEFGVEYDSKMASARKAASSLFPETLAARLRETGIIDDPQFVKAMSIVGAEMGDTGLVMGQASSRKKDGYDWVRARCGQANN